MKYNLVENIERTTRSYAIQAKLSKHDAWLRLETNIDKKIQPGKPKWGQANLMVGWMAAAAVFLVVMYLGMFNTGKYSPEFYTSYTEMELVNLPDSSTVTLNSNSKMKYHYNKFTGERNVVLNGEAFFEVQKGRKFIVDFDGGSLNVIGTKFNVMAYNPNYLNIDCTEGRVEFHFGKQIVILNAGEGAKVYYGQISGPFRSESERIVEHVKGLYFWNKVSVDELVHLIGFRFGYNIILHPDVAKRNFSGKIDLSDLHSALNIVSYAMDLKYIVDDEGQTITVNAK